MDARGGIEPRSKVLQLSVWTHARRNLSGLARHLMRPRETFDTRGRKRDAGPCQPALYLVAPARRSMDAI
jgi:hypothetical protein